MKYQWLFTYTGKASLMLDCGSQIRVEGLHRNVVTTFLAIHDGDNVNMFVALQRETSVTAVHKVENGCFMHWKAVLAYLLRLAMKTLNGRGMYTVHGRYKTASGFMMQETLILAPYVSATALSHILGVDVEDIRKEMADYIVLDKTDLETQ